jgi:hypothetical protein
MKTVKPIETRYNGYRFRSRLEARWAVFFDELRLKYEYELEGFSLPSGAAYLGCKKRPLDRKPGLTHHQKSWTSFLCSTSHSRYAQKTCL